MRIIEVVSQLVFRNAPNLRVSEIPASRIPPTGFGVYKITGDLGAIYIVENAVGYCVNRFLERPISRCVLWSCVNAALGQDSVKFFRMSGKL